MDAFELKQANALFLLGAPRSGTTFLAKALNAHPSIIMTNETAVFLLLDGIIKKCKIGFKAGIHYGKEYNKLLSDHFADTARDIVEGYYTKICQTEKRNGIKYWGDKHPHHDACLKFINTLYPDARYIYIVRDPRDVACSISNMTKRDFRESLMIWRKINGPYKDLVSEFGPERVYSLRYEEMVENNEEALKNILHWLGLDFSQEVKGFIESHGKVNVHLLYLRRLIRQDFAATSVGRWKRDVAEQDKLWAEEFVGDLLDYYGYQRHESVK